MPFDDLDLEFEDEDEAKKKKSEAVEVDVDLEFTSPGIKLPGPMIKPDAGADSGPRPNPSANRPAEIKKLDEARAQAKRTPVAKSQAASSSAPKVIGTSALKQAPDLEEANQDVMVLREEMRRVEFDAQVKVALAEYKIELLSELFCDIKFLEYHIGQLLVRLNAKHPDTKQEVMMIKKLLADFTAKKRK